jgi:hypothetical protein
MSKRLQFVESLSLTIILFLASLTSLGAATPRERKFEFEYKATVKDIPTGAKKVELWIPVPHDSPFQKITGMQIDSPFPYQIHTAQYGNRILHISLQNPQQSSLTVSMRFTTARKEHIQERLQQTASNTELQTGLR